MQQAHEFARQLAAQGVMIVSGGALGIDGAAHRGAIGSTVVILGSGINQVYPLRHASLFDHVVEAGGAVVSSFDANMVPRPGCFVTRNRFIAALADIVVVVEAQVRSGSLSTARMGSQLGKIVMAVPGSPGCDHLIASATARVTLSVADIFAAFEGTSRTLTLPGITDDNCARVVAALVDEPVDEDSLAEVAGLSLQQTLRALARLEGTGHLVCFPGRRFAKAATFSPATT
jgi:DNA processing protein